ncbi:F-box protein At3g07870-like [Lolium perenne]|uniref:F-box protein At3g07870-like n=1 Tax=Lolium perenne TaxID=4522 RepID=UPI003A9A2D33
MASLGEDIARDILLKLPTTDLLRCSCVCKLWRGIVHDPSFRTLHSNASAAETETLLVQEFRGRGVGLKMTVLTVTSGKPMSRFTEMPGGYRPINACNGFLLLASSVPDWPVYVCNPATGEKLKILAPPLMDHLEGRTYALGFSPSTRQYKIFSLSFTNTSLEDTHETCVDVCTLGADDGMWRRHQDLFRALYSLHHPPPVLMDGKLYVVVKQLGIYWAPDTMMLVIDVASEEHGRYYLPEKSTCFHKARVHTFNLCGQLCLAIRISGQRRVNFWVMLSLQGKPHVNKWRTPDWERRYSFYLNADDGKDGDKPYCAWLDSKNGLLCYRFGDHLYRYDITRKRKKPQIQLPLAVMPFARPDDQQWNVYEGYRPSFLSPHLTLGTTLLPKKQHYQEEDCEQAGLLHALGYHQSSKKRRSTNTSDCTNHPSRPAKRICKL